MGLKLIKVVAAVALFIYLLFLIAAQAPATWGVWAIHNASPQVRLTGISGTIWNGRAVDGTVAVGNQLIPLKNLRWHINPWSLLSLRACTDVSAELLNQPASGTLCQSMGNITTLRDVQLGAPMSLLGQRMAIDVSGQGSLQLQSARLKGERVEQLDGNFSWRDARWTDGDRWYNVGSFAARLTENEQGGIRAEVFDLDGPFRVQLTGNFVLHQEPVIKGTVHPTPEAPKPIRAALEFVGERLDDGGFRLAWPPGS